MNAHDLLLSKIRCLRTLTHSIVVLLSLLLFLVDGDALRWGIVALCMVHLCSTEFVYRVEA